MPKVKDSEREKLLERKREKQKALSAKEEEKLEKRKAKEEQAKMRKLIDKEKEQEKKMRRKSTKPNSSGKGSGDATATGLMDFVQSDKNPIPLFLEKCVEFIEHEGLDSEGIYRVPGNRAHVDLLYQKMQEGKLTWPQPDLSHKQRTC